MSGLLAGGEIATELLKELLTLTRRVFLCRQTAVQLRRSVEAILPIISSLHPPYGQLRPPRQSQLSDLLRLLRLALDLARQLSASSRFNVYRTVQLSRKMERVEGDIGRWIQRLLPVHVMDDVVRMRVESNARFDRLERKIEGVGDRKIGSLGVGDGKIGSLGFGDGKIGSLGVLGREEGVLVGSGVGVGKERVKDMLMLELGGRGGGGGGGGELVGICGIGGSGKTTLAREICKDARIRSMCCVLGF